MKKIFSKPEMDIKSFMSENIVTVSAAYNNNTVEDGAEGYTIGSISINKFKQVDLGFIW